MHIDCEGVEADDKFLGSFARVLLGGLDFLGLHVPAGVGNIDGALFQRRDADARSTAGDFHVHVGRRLLVLLRPCLGQVNHGVGAFVLDGLLLGGITAAAGFAFAAAGLQQTHSEGRRRDRRMEFAEG